MTEKVGFYGILNFPSYHYLANTTLPLPTYPFILVLEAKLFYSLVKDLLIHSTPCFFPLTDTY